MRLVLWDVDGTLLTAGPAVVDAFGAAFTASTGVAWAPRRLDAAGRCDLWIAPAFFAQHGVAFDDPPAFFARYAAEFTARRARVRSEGRLLPGAPEVLARLATTPGTVQALITGNIREVALAKVAAFDLHEHLDVDAGGYGDDSADRGEVARLARRRAETRHGPFDAVTVVGDTPRDIDAARSAGAVAVGVATGRSTAADLADAGADHVLDDLSDVDAVVALLTAVR